MRILLYLLTNLLVVLTISLVLSLLTAAGLLPPELPLLQLLGQGGGATERWLLGTVAGLARKAELPMPAVGVDDSPEWNAFATGPLEGMPPDELEAVLAHELSHVANGDMVTMTLLRG